ncbi:MAG: class I SAM-dependent methyltransferase [Candidatus Pacearchaeota archaeon]
MFNLIKRRAIKSLKKEKNLLNQKFLEYIILTNAAFSEGHGTDGSNYLGFGILYYSFVHLLKANVSVCLGSGGGFVPRLMRQAQIDLGIKNKSKTILVDANLPELGYGSPDYINKNSFFRTFYPDIKILFKTTKEAIKYFEENKIKIDYLHIDADHSYEGVSFDYKTYKLFMSKNFIITIHDTGIYPGVKKLIKELHKERDIEILNFDYLWAGLSIIKPKKAPIKKILKPSKKDFLTRVDYSFGLIGKFLNTFFPKIYKSLRE